MNFLCDVQCQVLNGWCGRDHGAYSFVMAS
jgi:hypothetical protein